MWIQSLKEFKQEIINNWIRLHWLTMAKIGDDIECIKWVITKQGDKIKWKIFKLIDVVVESHEWGYLGFTRRIKIEWYIDEDFNPNKFKKINK